LNKVKREKELLQQQIEHEQSSRAELKDKLEQLRITQEMQERTIEEGEEDEDEVDDSILPDLAAKAHIHEE